MFGISSFRLIAYGLIAAAIGFLILREHWAVQGRKAAVIELSNTKIVLEQERKNLAQMQADNELNKTTSHALQERLTAIESERRSDPLPGLRCRSSVPSTVAKSGTAAGANDAQSGRESQTAEVDFDPTPALDQYGTDCAVIAERLSALQNWELAREH